MVNWKPDSLHKVSGFGFFCSLLYFCFLPHTLPPLSPSRSIELRSSTFKIIREKTKNPAESDVINGKMPRLRYGWMLAGLQTAVYLCGKIVSPRSCRVKISASGLRTFVDEKCYIVTKKVRRIGCFLDNVYYLCRRKMLQCNKKSTLHGYKKR